MPLNEHEKYLLADFLNHMDEALLKHLSGSVTMGRMKCKSREEAMNCILLHTTSLQDVFKLKRISTIVLLTYLSRLNESVPGTATKDYLVHRVFQKWNIPPPAYLPQSGNVVSPAVPTHPYSTNYQSPTLHLSAVSLPTVPNNQLELMTGAARTSNQPNTADSFAQMIRSKELLKEVNTLAFNEYIVAFAQTFYQLLNSPSGQYQHSFDNSHFFGECKVKIEIKGDQELIELEGEGLAEVLTVLSDLKKDYQLFFSPNLTEQGVRSKRDSHGLVSAVVCGTLHQRSGPVGVFEQCFIMSPDPFARDGHKIQETVLILRSSNAVSSYSQLMFTSGKNGLVTPAINDSSVNAISTCIGDSNHLAIKDATYLH